MPTRKLKYDDLKKQRDELKGLLLEMKNIIDVSSGVVLNGGLTLKWSSLSIMHDLEKACAPEEAPAKRPS